MTALDQMLAAWDETALIGLASKGVVVRAGKDAGKVKTVSKSGSLARLSVLTETVELAAPDPRKSICTCPATGVCRHIVAAILALRDGAEGTPGDDLDIAALPFDEIQNFARADWPSALALAETEAQIDGDATRTVMFPETRDTVTFPAGQPLTAAAYKGAKASRARRATAAAALALARAAGRDLPEAILADHVSRQVDEQTLERAQNSLEHAVQALAAGTLAQAADTLFSLAISTRAEAIPRLAAELRNLSKRFDEDRLRQADETPEGLLGGLARTYALTWALRRTPDDPALLGTLSRSFTPSGARTLCFLGGEHWSTPAGARGLTLAFLDQQGRSIHRATQARAAGTDLIFTGQQAWHQPLWGIGTPQTLGARLIYLPDAHLALDGGLGLTQAGEATTPAEPPNAPAQTKWFGLSDVIGAQLGLGLRRKPGEALVLLRPATTTPPTFDAYDQVWHWPWVDADGDVLLLRLPSEIRTAPEQLDTVRPILGLAALRPSGAARLISIWTAKCDGPISLQQHAVPGPTGLAKSLAKVRNALPRREAAPPPDLVRLLLDRAAEATLQRLNRPISIEPLASDARGLGLHQIAQGLERLDGGPRAALQLGWTLALARDLIEA